MPATNTFTNSWNKIIDLTYQFQIKCQYFHWKLTCPRRGILISKYCDFLRIYRRNKIHCRTGAQTWPLVCVARVNRSVWRWDFRLPRWRVWRWLSSGMLRRVIWQILTDVSEVITAFIMRTISKTVSVYHTTRRNIPEHSHIQECYNSIERSRLLCVEIFIGSLFSLADTETDIDCMTTTVKRGGEIGRLFVTSYEINDWALR
jgi:hypothetical protein